MASQGDTQGHPRHQLDRFDLCQLAAGLWWAAYHFGVNDAAA